MESASLVNTDDSFGTIVYDTLCRSWEVLKRLWPLYLIIFVPMNALAWVVATALEVLVDVMSGHAAPTNFFQPLSGLINAVGGFVAIIATARMVRALEEGREVNWKTVLRESLGRWGVTFATALLFGMACMFLVCFCIVPAIVFGVFFAFSVCAVALGDCGIIESLKVSKELVTGKWWWTALLLATLAMIAGMIGSFPGTAYFVGRLPVFICRVLQSEGTDIPLVAIIVAYVIDFFVGVIFMSMVYMVQCLPYVGQTLLYLRRKAAKGRAASSMPCAVAVECAV